MRTVSFVRNKFNAMLGVATITMSVNYIVMLSGSVIVGNLVGSNGLAGVNVCTPVFATAGFIASLLSVGTGLVFSQAMGAFDEQRAHGVFSQSASLAILSGLFIYLTMLFGETAFFDFTGVTGAVRAEASAYWYWQAVALGLTPAVLLMEALVYADGDSTIATIAGVCHVTGSIGFSILFTGMMGNSGGAAAGTALTMVIVLAVSSLHFLRKNNHLKWAWHFSRKDLGATVAASLADASVYGCWGVLVLIVNKYVIVNWGEGLLPVVALAASVMEFSIVFDGVGEAIIPLGGMYDGERNRPAMRELANHSAFMATMEGVICGAIFFALAPVLAPLYGIRGDSAALLPHAIKVIRCLSLAMPFMGFLMMANTHFLVVHHVAFAVSVTVVKDFLLPCICVLSFGSLIGTIDGVFYGFPVGYALAGLYPFAFVLLRYGKSQFPWLVQRDNGKSINFAIRMNRQSLTSARDRIAEFLTARKVPDLIVKRVMLTVEETGVLTIDRNSASRAPISEYFVSLNQPGFVRLVTRDTGRAFDVSVSTGFLRSFAERRYLNTLSCNRSEYYFKV